MKDCAFVPLLGKDLDMSPRVVARLGALQFVFAGGIVFGMLECPEYSKMESIFLLSSTSVVPIEFQGVAMRGNNVSDSSENS